MVKTLEERLQQRLADKEKRLKRKPYERKPHEIKVKIIKRKKLNSKEKIILKISNYHKRIIETELNYSENMLKYDIEQEEINKKLRKTLRSRVISALKGKKKSDTTIKLIGCSVVYLKDYLESQFVDGMSWDNHGCYGWHIDHIRPCASFDLSQEEEQQKCFHYSNLQPLWALENLKKSDKYIEPHIKP